jgi:glycosyltransferase involved in cell wall biosynthesis
MSEPRGSLTILRLLLSIGETSAPYNQFSLALSDKHDITICTFFKSDISPPNGITLFEGDGSLTGFYRILKAALNAKEYDIIHAHSPHVGSLFLVANLIYRKFIRSTVLTVHNSYQNFKLRNKLLLIPTFAFFQRVVCCSKASFESIPWFFKLLAGDRLSFVQNGMDIERVDRVLKNRRRNGQEDGFTVATVGRIIEIKNPLSILKAFQQSADQDSRLVFIGEGHLRGELLAELESFSLGKQVELTGLIPRDRVYEYLTGTDLFISISQGEGLPVAVLEAMACRCLVILSDIPPHREIADGADFIPLIHPDDVAGLAREIKRIRHMSPTDRSEIGEKNRKLVEDRFSLTTMHKRYEEVYAQMLG